MEVKAGYKQTDAGVIPRDWEVVSVGDLASFRSGVGINIAKLFQESSDAPAPVYGGNGIAGYTTHALVRNPMVVIGRVGQRCGEVHLTRGPSWITDNALYPRTLHRPIHIPFLASALMAVGLNERKNRNDLPLLTQSILHAVQIGIPATEAEQEAIAEALSDADALIESLEQLLFKKRQLKQGATQELLTGMKRLPGFETKPIYKQTEVGIIPEDWEVESVGQHLRRKPSYGINAPAVPFNSRFPTYLRITDITEDGRFSGAARASVDHPAADSYLLETGDIVFARTGASVGKSYLYNSRDGHLVFAGFLIRLSPDPGGLLPAFLSFYAQSRTYWNWVKANSMRSGQPGINGREYASLPIPLPPTKAEQEAIVAILSDMDTEIAAHEARLAKTLQIKKGMMKELLTGRIRLV